jgi:hypothetical protein
MSRKAEADATKPQTKPILAAHLDPLAFDQLDVTERFGH